MTIGLSLAAVVPAVDHLLPTGLAAPAALLATGGGATIDGAALLTALAGTLVLLGACAGLAVAAFRRREL